MTADLQRNVKARVRLAGWAGTYCVPRDADVLVNATSIGLYPAVDAMPAIDLSGASKHLLVCDAVFNPPETRLLAAAKAHGLRTLDGLSMLVYQGVIGFEIWTGRKAPERVMKDALRRALLGES